MTNPRFHQLVTMLEDGQIGDVEFTELALEAEATTEQIAQALADTRAEDGEIDF